MNKRQLFGKGSETMHYNTYVDIYSIDYYYYRFRKPCITALAKDSGKVVIKNKCRNCVCVCWQVKASYYGFR